MPATKIYVGLKAQPDSVTYEVFRSPQEPTFASHGDQFNAVIGPFPTMRGAQFMRDYGRSNPHCRTVAEAERLAKHYLEPGLLTGTQALRDLEILSGWRP